MQQLSQNEYAYISGGFGLPGAGFGGALGGLSYLGSAATSGSFSWSGFGTAVVVGAASFHARPSLTYVQYRPVCVRPLPGDNVGAVVSSACKCEAALT